MEWQPIESAPKDGTAFLCVHPPMHPEVAHWECVLVRLNFDMSVTEISATHCMPLPAPRQIDTKPPHLYGAGVGFMA